MRKRIVTKQTYQLQAKAFPTGECKRLADPRPKQLNNLTHKKQ